jgi:hypothetical protein
MGKNVIKKAVEENKSYSKLSWIVFLSTLIVSLISLISVIFPVLISDAVVPNGFTHMGLSVFLVDPYETGPLAELLILSNAVIFGLYIFRKKIPKISNIFSFDVPQKISLVVVLIVIVTYGIISFPEVYTEEIYDDWKQNVVPGLETFDVSEMGNLGPNVRYFLLQQSMILFGSYKIIPLFSSMALLGLTYLFTTSLTKNRFAGLVSMGIVLQSYLFLTFDTSSTYTTFWIMFYVLSLYAVVRLWFTNPVIFAASFLSKSLTALFVPMSIFFILNSYIPKKQKIILVGITVVAITYGSSVMISNGILSEEFMAHEFWTGFSAFAFSMRFDIITILFLVPLVFGLFVASKNNRHANSISVLIGGILFSAPVLSGLTIMTNQPYRFLILIVFFAVGVGILFSKKNQ